MTLHRFFVSKDILTQDDDSPVLLRKDILLPEEVSFQISKVLRLKIGDTILLLDNSGFEYGIELANIDPKKTSGRLITKKFNSNEPEINITLFQSIISKDNFELVLQKGTEIGVKTFVPLKTQRTQYDLKLDKYDRLKKILKEASEQSERGIIPELAQPIKFTEITALISQFDAAFIAWEREGLSKKLNVQNYPTAKKIAVFIGPEGGFTDEEIETAKTAGITTISLGPRVLRSETAGIILPALILN